MSSPHASEPAGKQAGKSGCVADRRFVVHCKRAAYDVYVGRGRDPSTGAPNAGWGNPFVIGRDGDRATVIAKHRAWFLSQPDLVARAKPELRGRVLACW